MTFVSHLACSRTGQHFEPDRVYNLSPEGAPLLVEYDLDRARRELRREEVCQGPRSMWRWAPLLPVRNSAHIVSLGEGGTPLLRARRLGTKLGAANLWIKDEGGNPTGTFKARGMACAVSMAKELGLTKLAAPSAGNAGGALAAYAAAAGLEALVAMPRDAPEANVLEAKACGARVVLVDGLISDCGRLIGRQVAAGGWFDVSTLKEPYRIEGKKTMGLELAEQLGWRSPDAILYPAGGGVGLIGMWKAFAELAALGWIGKKQPKMIAVQAAGCAPLVRAFEQGAEASEFWEKAVTLCSGLRVPKALGDFLVLRAVRESGGTCIAVSDRETLQAARLTASAEGLFAAPEGAACVAALAKLLANGFLQPGEEIVVLNTGSGYKYLDSWRTLFAPEPTAEERQGGMILPR